KVAGTNHARKLQTSVTIREKSYGNNRRRRHFKSADISGAVASDTALVGREADCAVAGINPRAVFQPRHGQGRSAVVSQWAQTVIGVIEAGWVRKVATLIRTDVVSAISDRADSIRAGRTVGNDGVSQRHQPGTVAEISADTIAVCIAGAACA